MKELQQNNLNQSLISNSNTRSLKRKPTFCCDEKIVFNCSKYRKRIRYNLPDHLTTIPEVDENEHNETEFENECKRYAEEMKAKNKRSISTIEAELVPLCMAYSTVSDKMKSSADVDKTNKFVHEMEYKAPSYPLILTDSATKIDVYMNDEISSKPSIKTEISNEIDELACSAPANSIVSSNEFQVNSEDAIITSDKSFQVDKKLNDEA